MINWIVDGLNKIKFDVPDWVPGIGGKKFGFNISKFASNSLILISSGPTPFIGEIEPCKT